MSVLPDTWIHRLGEDLVSPFRPEQVQPASIDLLLGDEFRVFDHHHTRVVDMHDPSTYADATKQVLVGEEGFVLHPGEFVLATTQETVRLESSMMARVEGKSSVGRLGLIIHATAGFIDPGFVGEVTLEMTNLLRVPIVLYPGDPICQVSFSMMYEPVARPYEGRYQGQKGTTASRYLAPHCDECQDQGSGDKRSGCPGCGRMTPR